MNADPDSDARAVATPWRCREFSPPVFEAWLHRFCTQGYCASLVGLLLKFERLLKAPLDGPQRLAVMRALMPLADDLSDDLPTPPRDAKAISHGLAQRLGGAVFKNLKRTLEALDQGGAALIGEHAEGRHWVVARMFACLRFQIEHGARWGKVWPPNTWQDLHDLYAYCNNRLSGGVFAPAPRSGAVAPGETLCDPPTAYKRLLMVGLCAMEDAGPLWLTAGAGRFEAWARASELRDPAAYLGVMGAYVVDQSADAPPRRVSGAVGEVSGARALVLPPDFLAALDAAKPMAERAPGP